MAFNKKRSQNQYLHPFYSDYVEEESLWKSVTVQVTECDIQREYEMHGQRHLMRIAKPVLPVEHRQQQLELEMNPGNIFWISVSDYQPNRAFVVYRFFIDIGPLADKIFTHSNLMYLRYFDTTDCEIALSYDKQKIGYGGDILVRVKAENPVQTNLEPHSLAKNADRMPPLYDAIECSVSEEVKVHMEQEMSTCVIDMDTVQSIKVAKHIKPPPKGESGLLRWLKQKISYLFYFS